METEEIIEKIVEDTDLDEEEVEEELEDKMEEFSGLVSEEGAAHLVAKENDVDIAEASKQDLKVDNIVPDMRKVSLKARVVNITEPNTFERDDDEEDGKVQNMVLGDDTGTIRLTLWDEQTEIAEKVEEGDAIKIGGAYTVEDNRGNAELRLGDDVQVKMAEDDEVPEVESTEGSTTKASIGEVRSENANFEITGMVMDIYTSNPFYRIDPDSGDTVREDDDGNYVTDDGDEVEEPDHRLAISGVVDDGTGNIRVVLFGDQARKLLDITEEEERDGDKEAVEEAAEEAIGEEITVQGSTRYNDYFGTIEILGNSFEKVSTEERIDDLLDIMEA